jgi:FkbM family methyltransferase
MAYEVRSLLRSAAAKMLSSIPQFKGKGRITLLIDRLLTNERDPASYITTGTLNGGRRFSFDLRPWGQKFAFYYGEWELPHVEALRRFYRGGVFLDIGSSIGLYPVSLGREVAVKGGSIISIEPVAVNYERQKRNLQLNGLEPLVTLVTVGLGAADGEVRMSMDPLRADNNALVSANGDIAVRIARLDDVIAELGWPQITLIKMDVEGFEPEIITGGRETIRRTLPLIFAEFNRERMRINGTTMDDSWIFLTSCSYACYRLLAGRFEQLREPGEVQDLYFIPPGWGDPNRPSAPTTA